MAVTSQGPTVNAWHRDGILFEAYDYPPGPKGGLPSHAHAELQLTASFGVAGEYRLRGERHVVPPGSVTAIAPGEAHAVADLADRTRHGRFLMMYVPEGSLAAAGLATSAPRRSPVAADARLAELMRVAHSASREPDALRFSELWHELVVALPGRARPAPDRSDLSPRRARQAVARARAHLDAGFAGQVRLEELARLGGLSPQRLNRSFREQLGIPPHRYQVGLRVDHAKRLLAAGEPIGRVALDAGFSDQAHLTRHFRRVVGTTPGRYRPRAARTF